MQQIQLKFILPFASFSETIALPQDYTVSDLQSHIWEYFQISSEKQFLRLRNKEIDVKKRYFSLRNLWFLDKNHRVFSFEFLRNRFSKPDSHRKSR